MRAVAVRQFKAVPEPVEVPDPSPEPHQVLVRVTAAGLNPFDSMIVDGALGPAVPSEFPLVPGIDFAGRVAATGPGATRFAVGDAVFGQAFQPPHGTYAELVAVAEDGPIARAPESLELKTASAVPTAGMTALAVLDHPAVRGRGSMLVIGAAGGVGTFLTQLAAARDVRVLAVTRGDESVRLGLFGAAGAIDSTTESVRARVRAEYPDGVDVLVDLASGDAEAFQAHATLVRPGGVALTTRGVAPEGAEPAPGVTGVNFSAKPSAELLEALAKEIDNGALRVSVESEVPLEQAGLALARNRSGGARGKTIVVP